MADTDGGLGRDAFYLDVTAREFGWQVVWEPDAGVMMSKGDWTVLVLFDQGGVFRSARAIGPGSESHGADAAADGRRARTLGHPVGGLACRCPDLVRHCFDEASGGAGFFLVHP